MLPVTLVKPCAVQPPAAEQHDDKQRMSRHLALCRLKQEFGAAGTSHLGVINRGLCQAISREYSTTGVRVFRLRDDIAAGLRPALLLLLCAIGFTSDRVLEPFQLALARPSGGKGSCHLPALGASAHG